MGKDLHTQRCRVPEERDSRIWGAGGIWGGQENAKGGVLSRTNAMTILVKAQERGTGSLKSTVPESRRKPEGRTMSQAVEYPRSQVHGYPPEPRFQTYKGETVSLAFQTWGENGWLCGSPQLRFWSDGSEKRAWGSPKSWLLRFGAIPNSGFGGNERED